MNNNDNIRCSLKYKFYYKDNFNSIEKKNEKLA